MDTRCYLAIDAKSFYASVECVERGLDPLTTNLVVADPERSQGTICLAVSPSLKALGIKGRCRLNEIPTSIPFIIAQPRMQKYIDYSAEIYGTYLRYVSPEDIFSYSIDEVFIDVTGYLNYYGKTPREMAVMLMEAVKQSTGIRVTCGIGTNLYLAKIALDILAKHAPDFIGVLDEETYCQTLWDHTPITDFWRIGHGTANRLGKYGIRTMRQIAAASEDFLYRRFGIDAELLFDHAWGREPVTIRDIKSYKPKTNSLSSGQVLMRDYSFDEARLIVQEMMDLLCLEMVSKKVVTSSVFLYVGYSSYYEAKPSTGTANIHIETNADSVLIPAVVRLYGQITRKDIPIRRVCMSCNHVVSEDGTACQLSLFESRITFDALDRAHKRQEAMLDIKNRFGKNAIFRAMDLQDAATTLQRNEQIGGHKRGVS